jgi:hypothetical protein
MYEPRTGTRLRRTHAEGQDAPESSCIEVPLKWPARMHEGTVVNPP